MSSYQPRISIPESWAQIGACPICNARGLSVVHSTGHPDQLSCPNCHVSFELETDGPNIRLMVLPPSYAAFLQPAWQSWMSVFEINHQIKSGTELHPVEHPALNPIPEEKVVQNPVTYTTPLSESAPSMFDEFLPVDPLTQEEVVTRAIGLAELGNNNTEIRATLQRFSATPEQIEQALNVVRSQRKQKKSNTPRTVIYVLIAILLCLGLSAVILPILDIPRYLGNFQPIWNTLQKSFTQNSIYGGITGPNPTQPVKQTTIHSLPSDGESYFSVVWKINAKSTWNDKYQSLLSVTPPTELRNIHQQVLDHFFYVAVLEAASSGNTQVFNDLCGSQGSDAANRCASVDQNTIVAYQQFVTERNSLYDWWLTSPCKSYLDYFNLNKVPWPWGEGQCSYP